MKRVNLTPVLELGTNKILYYIDESSNTKYYPEDKEGVTMQCPEGFIFINEKGDIIDTKKISLKRKYPQYPKTCKECCEILGCKADQFYTDFTRDGLDVEISDYEYKIDDLLQYFRKLIYCRSAYWKIAGEQMGLGKPWEPTTETVYCISRSNNILKCSYRGGKCNILEFPTEEMRDAFYENFKDLIETCKELL